MTNTRKKIKIKISLPKGYPKEYFLRQKINILKHIEFIFDETEKTVDWWFVLHRSALQKRSSAVCPKDRVIFISMEPNDSGESNINKFLNQFSEVYAIDPQLIHGNQKVQNWQIPWVGTKIRFDKGNHCFSKDGVISFADLEKPIVCQKINRVSIINSVKRSLPGHVRRANLLDALSKSSVGKYLDFYGEGYQTFEDKYDILKRYKYTIVIENDILDGYWTEKLSDAFISECLPFYIGCPNILEFFPSNSLINIGNQPLDEIIQTIEKCILTDAYQQKFNAILQAKYLILNDYNLLEKLVSFAENSKNCLNYERVTLQSLKLAQGNVIFRNIKKLFRKKLFRNR